MAENALPLFANAGRFYVYVYRDPRPRKGNAAIYVGKGSPKWNRADDHWVRSAPNPILRRVLTKIRHAGLAPTREIVAWYDDEAAAFSCERALIKTFGRRDLATGSLCNLTDGGDGASGHVHSLETRAKMSALAVGRKFSAEHRAKLSAARKNRVIASETIERIKATLARPEVKQKMAARIGRVASPESRAKMSAAQKGKRHHTAPRTRPPEEIAKRAASLRATHARKKLARICNSGAAPSHA